VQSSVRSSPRPSCPSRTVGDTVLAEAISGGAAKTSPAAERVDTRGLSGYLSEAARPKRTRNSFWIRAFGSYRMLNLKVASGLRASCHLLVFEKLGYAARDRPEADRLHDQIHHPIEIAVLQHLGIRRQEGVVSKPHRKRDEQHRKKERVVDWVRRRSSSFRSFRIRFCRAVAGSFTHRESS
jgi:hypothetical protein